MQHTCRRYRVSGRVQGVFFRASAQQQAAGLGLNGWVRNLPDGRVEAFACGPAQRLETFERWLAQGPDMARVDSVETTTEDYEQCDGFTIR